jgi:hypothetical protein
VTPLTPAHKATGITPGTLFSWSSPPAAYANVVVAAYGGALVHRITMGNSVDLYSLRTLFGIPAPGGTTGNWNVLSIGPATNLDEMLIAFDSYLTDGEKPYSVLTSEYQSFKEAPFEP